MGVSFVVLNVSVELPKWWVNNGLIFLPSSDSFCKDIVMHITLPHIGDEWLLVLCCEG